MALASAFLNPGILYPREKSFEEHLASMIKKGTRAHAMSSGLSPADLINLIYVFAIFLITKALGYLIFYKFFFFSVGKLCFFSG